jgi:tryptophan-rich sensory protein
MAAVPAITIFATGAKFRVNDVKEFPGRPESPVFLTAWVVICVALALAVVVASFRFDTVSLSVLIGVTAAFSAASSTWLYVNSARGSGKSTQVMGIVLLLGTLLLTSSVTASPDDVDSSKLASLLIAPIPAWATYALALDLMNANL